MPVEKTASASDDGSCLASRYQRICNNDEAKSLDSVSTDHLCILWCNQLVEMDLRALFDCVGTKTRPPNITYDLEREILALDCYFQSHTFKKKSSIRGQDETRARKRIDRRHH
ncbi:uncharacterized protein [Neodiprion pinetum]|uniref:uncharacterized protein n=1 Tax=Neodiprion pinetum TaxID=441929 RepID=UPI001EDE46D5|nr:uncharacterized protein LOC124213853 isoform X1 [Neodiprion pinetum]XP_046471501.1 uncharacterized protein LOC124213853 isoform X1 [Neodiprion pinetum]XP_046471502.1 uncharacterized protein LOC124213853 isoform X1 [Neodiprion pinetum]XP_046471503.1 uncharacterized protein LOC124213853 isoform X1 [Neodiprion pinetum]